MWGLKNPRFSGKRVLVFIASEKLKPFDNG